MLILVAYASRHGATQETAARIAGRLAEAGVSAELRRVDEVDTLDGYDTVVFGAPVYDQSWPPEANDFVAEFRITLSARPLWLFSVGSFGDTKHLIGPLTHKEPKGRDQLESILEELRGIAFNNGQSSSAPPVRVESVWSRLISWLRR